MTTVSPMYIRAMIKNLIQRKRRSVSRNTFPQISGCLRRPANSISPRSEDGGVTNICMQGKSKFHLPFPRRHDGSLAVSSAPFSRFPSFCDLVTDEFLRLTRISFRRREERERERGKWNVEQKPKKQKKKNERGSELWLTSVQRTCFLSQCPVISRLEAGEKFQRGLKKPGTYCISYHSR